MQSISPVDSAALTTDLAVLGIDLIALEVDRIADGIDSIADAIDLDLRGGRNKKSAASPPR